MLGLPDWGLASWSWFEYGHWSLVDPNSEFWILIFEGAKTICAPKVLILGFRGCWRILTGVLHLDTDLNIVTGLWFTHVPNFGSILNFKGKRILMYSKSRFRALEEAGSSWLIHVLLISTGVVQQHHNEARLRTNSKIISNLQDNLWGPIKVIRSEVY